MKIGIVIGHNSAAQGATRVTDGWSEFRWNSNLADMIKQHDPASIAIFRRQAGLGYSREIDKVYAETDAWGADVTIELHFNASPNPSARGCLMLSSGTPASRRLAAVMQEKCLRVMGNQDRGVIIRGRHDLGGRSLWQGRAPAVMTEPYFGSNVEDCMRADISIDQLAEAHYRAARQFLMEGAVA